MKNILKLFLITVFYTFLTSCIDESKRIDVIKQKFPGCKFSVLAQHVHYQYVIEDTNNNIIGIDFYPNSTRLSSIKIIK